MTLSEFLKYVETRKPLRGDEIHQFMNRVSNEARHTTSKLNGSYHDPEEIHELLSHLFDKPVDPSFRVSPPSYMDFRRGITVGKNVFVNAYCHFQDHGGMTLDDGCQIGHNVVFATLNHGFAPGDRSTTYPVPIVPKKNAWIGSNATILSGVTIGENVTVRAGSIVTKNVPDNAIVGGVPAKAIKYIQ